MSRHPTGAVERRTTPRIETTLEGRLFPGGQACAILDLSEGGARLSMAHPYDLGVEVLVIEWESGRAHDGQVVWTTDREAGVRFLRSCHLQGRVPVGFADAQAAWQADQAPRA
jgi:hypothetical protein